MATAIRKRNGICDDRVVTAPQAAEALTARAANDDDIGESRWPPVLALVVFLILNISIRVWLPGDAEIRVPWLLPTLEVALIAVLLAHPAHLVRRRPWVRPTAIAFVVILVLAALWATALLVYDLIRGRGVTNSASELLASGALIWLGNNISFALLYWLVDSGGPIARSGNPTPVDFAFTQQLSPEIKPGWRPVFLDYLHLGFTNATAFSPTDVMPLTLRAKYTMLVQSTVALALFGLIVARAVNAFT